MDYKDFLQLFLDLLDEVDIKKKSAQVEIINEKKAIFSFE